MGLRAALLGAVLGAFALSPSGCAAERSSSRSGVAAAASSAASPARVEDAAAAASASAAAPVMQRPVPSWDKGKTASPVDAATAGAQGFVVLDLGEDWVPYLFTERDLPNETPQPNAYRSTYLALARGELPSDAKDVYFTARVKRDRYLELYGIMPTLSVLRARLEAIQNLKCESQLDLTPLAKYRGIIGYRDNAKARHDATQFALMEKRLEGLLEKHKLDDPEALDKKKLSASDLAFLRQYEKIGPAARAVRAAQARLKCEGYYEGKGKPLEGALDWSTNEALAEFERRHRVFGWGFLSKDTMAALQTPGLELERQAVVRVLTERAMHAAGFVEDGSSPFGDKPATFRGSDGKDHPVPNLLQETQDAIVKAFGLETPESTLAWLRQLGTLPAERLVAVRRPSMPEYYAYNMPLSVEIDRGDVWYEFPFDEKGKERGQPVSRRPHLTVYTEYRGQKIPLVYFNTTIGGWRSESVEGTVMWKYKNSPVGPRVWHQIVASPVWLPPPGTPANSLLKNGPDGPHVNYLEIGPGYASAYGLVAAYHEHFRKKDDGSLDIGGDDGIRTHGSVDYMSILERHSHGCHRLYNHLAVRLMSFVLRHRPHHRLGQQKVGYRMPLEQDDKEYQVEVDKGGYVFELDEPVFVDVLTGRIRGGKGLPIETALPKYDEKIGAYVAPDGQTVKVDRLGNVAPTPTPAPETAPNTPGGPGATSEPPDGGTVNAGFAARAAR